MMGWGYGGMNGWGYAFMGLSTLVFWGLLITVIVMVARYTGRSMRTGPASPPPSAEEVLAQRYARGEIHDEEYHSRLRTLRGRHDHPIGT